MSPSERSASPSRNRSQSCLAHPASSLHRLKHLPPEEALSCAHHPSPGSFFPGNTKELSQSGEESLRVTAQWQLSDSWKNPGSGSQGEPERGQTEPRVCSGGVLLYAAQVVTGLHTYTTSGRSGPCLPEKHPSQPRGFSAPALDLFLHRRDCHCEMQLWLTCLLFSLTFESFKSRDCQVWLILGSPEVSLELGT